MLTALSCALFALGYGVTHLLLPRLESAATAQGLVDQPGGRKSHARATPLAGGIAILAGVAIPCGLGVLWAFAAPSLGIPVPEALGTHLPGVRAKAADLMVILGLAAVHLVLGHLDDRRDLAAWPRLAVELAAGLALAAIGIRITIWIDTPVLHWILTAGFVAFVTNAINFLDNMNGLMAGVTYLGCVHLLVLGLASGQLFMVAILLCVAGALLAFLGRNFPRASVFIGDAGTLSMGFLLAALTVAFTFDEPTERPRPAVPAAVYLPLLVLAVPLADGLFVTITRLLRGVHPFTPGHDHLSHRLVRLGLTKVQATLCLWVIALGSGLAATLHVPWRLAATVYGPALLLLTFTVIHNQRRRA